MSIEIIFACLVIGVLLNFLRDFIVKGLTSFAKWLIKLFGNRSVSVEK